MSIAGLSAIWRNVIEDNPSSEKFIKKILGKAHKVLTCGPCFTYWSALAYTLVLSPLEVWAPVSWDIVWLSVAANIFLQWMAFAWLAVFLRFAYTSLQQYVRQNV